MSNSTKLYFFYSDWCQLCRLVQPRVDKLQEMFHETVDFEYSNIESDEESAKTYDIRSLPTLVLIQNGNIVWRKVGEFSEEALTTVLTHFVD